jgi:ACS family D-galactonate transporter-like MFS transporter
MANPAVALPTAAEPRSVRWPVVGLLTVGVIIAYIHRTNLSFALPVMPKSFGLTPQSSGLALSAFFWSYAALQIPSGWLVDRFGVKWPYAIAFLFWSFLAAATGLVTTVGALFAVRFLLGAGEAIATPASMRYIGCNFAEKQRGLAIGVYMSGTKYGPALGGLIIPYLIKYCGWQSMFLLTGLGAVLWVVPWMLLVRNDHPAAAPEKSQAGAQDSLSWGAILSSPVMWGTFLATFCYMYFVYFCMTWMPIYFKNRHGLSLTGSGWYTFLSFGGMATIAILAGFAADWLIARGRNPVAVRKAFTIAGFILAFSEVIGAFTNSIPVTLFFAVFSLSGLGLATANYWALTQTLVPGNTIGRVAGIQNTAANLAGVAAPWLTGLMVQHTGKFDAPLMAIGFWMAVGVGCYVFLVREKYAPK